MKIRAVQFFCFFFLTNKLANLIILSKILIPYFLSQGAQVRFIEFTSTRKIKRNNYGTAFRISCTDASSKILERTSRRNIIINTILPVRYFTVPVARFIVQRSKKITSNSLEMGLSCYSVYIL